MSWPAGSDAGSSTALLEQSVLRSMLLKRQMKTVLVLPAVLKEWLNMGYSASPTVAA